MGVADNKSYKNMTHFTGKYHQNNPANLKSLNKDNPDINDTIHENKEYANVEIEKGEVVLDPELKALFQAGGKKHHSGGTNVYLKDNAFVFSDHKSMNFNKLDYEKFKLKEGKTDTPAEILKKNVDTKHYNTLVENLSNPRKDDLAKRSSALMLEKYLEKIGEIAFVQESKKGFPTGVPTFAENIKPGFAPEVEEEMKENKQYMKYGGHALPKAQAGLFWKSLADVYGSLASGNLGRLRTIPDRMMMEKYLNRKQNIYQPAKQVENVTIQPPTNIQSSGRYGNSPYGNVNPNRGRYDGHEPRYNFPVNPIVQSKEFSGVVIDEPSSTTSTTTFPYGWQGPINQPTSLVIPPAASKAMTPNNVDETGSYSINPYWEYSNDQKASQAYAGIKAASVQRLMPYRSRFNATYMDPSLLNPEQFVNDMQTSANQSMRMSQYQNPILARSQNQSIFGQLLGQIGQVRSQYDNQNAQTLNQNRASDTAIRNQETNTNMINDQNYYTQSQEGIKNYNNMRDFMVDQFMNTRNQHAMENQSLAYNMLTQRNPALKYDWKTGRFLPTGKQILDADAVKTNDFTNILFELLRTSTDPRVQSSVIRTFGSLLSKNKTA